MRSSKERLPESLEEAFGRVVAARRVQMRLSQMDVAVATGYSLRYVGDVERGTKSATMRTLNDLATLLKVDLSTLMSEAENLLFANRKTRRSRS